MENLNDEIEESLNRNKKEFSHEIIDLNLLEVKNEKLLTNNPEQTPSENKIEVDPTSNNSPRSESKSKFYDNLTTVIKTQENILYMTGMASEKIKYANEISVDQLNTFKESSTKYGKYLKLIHEELQMIGDLMKKIKRDVKQ